MCVYHCQSGYPAWHLYEGKLCQFIKHLKKQHILKLLREGRKLYFERKVLIWNGLPQWLLSLMSNEGHCPMHIVNQWQISGALGSICLNYSAATVEAFSAGTKQTGGKLLFQDIIPSTGKQIWLLIHLSDKRLRWWHIQEREKKHKERNLRLTPRQAQHTDTIFSQWLYKPFNPTSGSINWRRGSAMQIR